MCPDAPLAPEYLALLLRTGGADEAVRRYLQCADRLAPAEQTAIRGLFAASHLADPSGLTGALPADDPILVDGRAARRSLEAYCRGEDVAAEEALRQLPFRSPYRDWAQVLKALL